MLTRQGPFLWLALAFAAFGAAAVVAAVMLADRYADETARQALIAYAGTMLVLAPVLLAAVWKIVDLRLLRSAAQMAVEVKAIAHGTSRYSLDEGPFAAIAPLPEAVNLLAGKLRDVRGQFDETVANATRRAEEDKGRLGAILNDLTEGVVVCNLKHQMVLYNQVALTMLHVTGEVGLGRSLFGMVNRDAVLHVFDLLVHKKRGEVSNAPFLAATTDGRSLLQGRMSLIQAAGEVTGYVVTFTDVTEMVAALGKRDHLLREVMTRLEGPAARLQALPQAQADAAEIGNLLAEVTQGYRSALAGWWPKADLHSSDLIDFVAARLDGGGVTITQTGLPIWLYGDSHSLGLALETLLRKLAEGQGVTALDLSAECDDQRAWVSLLWQGEALSPKQADCWLAEPLASGLGNMTVRDVLEHHSRSPLAVEQEGGSNRLRIFLQRGRDDHGSVPVSAAGRPEFFDFDLLAQDKNTGEMGDMPLSQLTYVVFDTETTGLHPSQGDEMVSIAGVRIVNGRILTGESFNRIINPGRPIPPESVKFHGITDEMVVDKPPLSVVLPQFKAYAADAVLVAHNAAFDLKFIRKDERRCGVTFDNAVLDTMLLSGYVDGTTEGQSLDAIADRYGIVITDRHTALGDALVTAAVLVRLIEALEAKGIKTLNQAVKTLNITMELHQRQLAF